MKMFFLFFNQDLCALRPAYIDIIYHNPGKSVPKTEKNLFFALCRTEKIPIVKLWETPENTACSRESFGGGPEEATAHGRSGCGIFSVYPAGARRLSA
jgi:hypothetical protein